MKEKLLLIHRSGRLMLCVKKGQTSASTDFVKAFNTLILCALLFVPAISSAQQWQVIGSEQEIASAASNFTSIATTLDGAATITYVAFTETNIAKAKKFDGSSWESLGSNISSGNATYTKIYADDNGGIYVSYVDASNDNKLALKKFNEVANTWEPLNNNAANLYVSAGSVTNSIGQYNSTARSSLAFDSNNVPYVFFGEGSGLNPTVKRFISNSWETLGGAAVSTQRAVGVNIAIDNNDVPYIVFANQAASNSTTGNAVMYRFLNNAWQSIAIPSPVSGGSSTSGATTAIRHTAITFNKDWNPVVSYFNANNSNKTTVIIYNKINGTWAYSAAISGRDISYNSLSRDDEGNVYSGFVDVVSSGSGRSVARVMKLAAGASAWSELKNADVAQGIGEPASNFSVSPDKNNKPYVVYTKANSSSVVTPVVQFFEAGTPPPPPPPPVPDSIVNTPKQVEKLNRGLIAIRTDSNSVYVGWRMFGTDPKSISFNIYRDSTKLNAQPITNSTNYVDSSSTNGKYTVKPVINGVEQGSEAAVSALAQNFLSIPLQIPSPGVTPPYTVTVGGNVESYPGGQPYTYNANDCSVGDLDGDGEYEIILKWEPSNARDNSQSGYTGNVYLDAYKLNGTRLWRIDLGRNIRAGAHYTQFLVYDLDGDGKAELACKTADATVDGAGTVIGDANADYRTSSGYVLSGPEFLTVFNGETGAAMATKPYIPARGTVSSWGDNYGNRVDRFIAAVAYLDGAHPSLVFGRGYYTRMVRAAWDWRDGQLTNRWTFDSNNPGNAAFAGQGNHQMTVGDVDGDGKQEIFNGSSGINDNGKGLWANGMGHGDALHMSDMDPDRPGLEMWQPYEYPPGNGKVGAALIDAKTGERIFTVSEATADVGRGMAADIDPRYKGYEVWAARGGLYTIKGVQIGTTKPSMNFGLWWDGDLSRELLDGTRITKWNYLNSSNNTIFAPAGVSSNNSTKATPNLSADILGDWREEVIFRTSDNSSLRIFSTTIPTAYKIYTLMHDPQYRAAIAWQNGAYNQPPHPGFYLGTDMDSVPTPNIEYVRDIIPPVALTKNISVVLHNGSVTVQPQDVDNGSYDAFEIASLTLSKTTFDCSNLGDNPVTLTATDTNGNTASSSAVITVIGSVPLAPAITVSRVDQTFTGGDEKTIFLGYGAQEIQLHAQIQGTDSVTYAWISSAYLDNPGSSNPVFKPTQAGVYTITVMGTNKYGCSASSSVTITVIDARCGNKVLICHKGNTICIASSAVKAHLGHGCSIGSCGGSSSTASVTEPDNTLSADQSSLSIYPNPASTRTRVDFYLSKGGKYTLEMYNLSGTLIDILRSGEIKSSESLSYELDVQKYIRGTYILRLRTDTEAISKRIIVQ